MKRLDRDAIIRENPLFEYCQSLGWAIKRDGPNGRFKCICPFHSEDTPSFTIYSQQNKGHCFGCGREDVSVIDVHMLTRGLSVGEAMRDLWARHHRSELSESIKNDEKRGGNESSNNSSSSASSGQADSKTKQAKKKEEVFHYDYHDAKGEMVFQVVKTVRPGVRNRYKQRRRVNGRWVDNIEGVERVPYRLPELLANPMSVWVVEGEKDVETLRAVGQTATCNSEGAGTWRQQEHSEPLRGLHVWLVPDSDEVGRDHARKVFALLDGVAASVTWLDLPPEFNGHRIKDVSDLHVACASEDAFLEALEKLQQQASQRKSVSSQEISALLAKILAENENLLRDYIVRTCSLSSASGLRTAGPSTRSILLLICTCIRPSSCAAKAGFSKY
jgi:DNA primase